jgi:hypothetical protein
MSGVVAPPMVAERSGDTPAPATEPERRPLAVDSAVDCTSAVDVRNSAVAVTWRRKRERARARERVKAE